MSFPRRTSALPALPALACLLLCVAACSKAPPAPPPAHLPRIPAGYGTPFDAAPVATVEARSLKLPAGWRDGGPLVLELPAALLMAELSAPFAELDRRLERRAACLAVAAGAERRCLPFRPMSGEDFGGWLDAPRPRGKVRLVMRADGIEVVTDRGKVPGPDRYGPSIPPVDGRPDFDTLDSILRRLEARFPDEEEAVLAPSAGLDLAQVGRALAILLGPDGERFPTVFLVYP